MSRVIAVVNQKGGVGKTTSAVNLASCLADEGFPTLLIDVDPQGNATSGVGVDKRGLQSTIYDSLLEEVPLADILVESNVERLRVAPSNSDLLSAEWSLTEDSNGKVQLKRVLAEYFWNTQGEPMTDFVVVDCPPSFGHLTLNAILAADSVLVPVQCEYYALEGLTEILTSTTLIREQYHPQLALEGILLTMADRRLNLSRQVEEDIRAAYGDYVFQSVVSRSVRLSEAPSHGLPIIMYDPSSVGALSYNKLAQEVLDYEKKSTRSWPLRASV